MMTMGGTWRGRLLPIAWMLVVGCGSDDVPDTGLQQGPGCPAGAIGRSATTPVVEDLDRAGPYGSATFTLAATADSGGATVYHPTSATPPFAYAVFCPPWKTGQASFAAWGPFFASHGIVLATMDAATLDDFSPRRALGLTQIMDALRGENTREGGPLRGKLDEARAGVLGWSMGGGAVLLASGDHPEWKSAVLFAPNTLFAQGYQASSSRSTTPTLLLNGAEDTTALGGGGQSEGAYESLPASTPKLFYLHAKLGHFEWSTPAPADAGSVIGRYVMAWEKTFLEGDPRYEAFLEVPGPDAQTFQSNL